METKHISKSPNAPRTSVPSSLPLPEMVKGRFVSFSAHSPHTYPAPRLLVTAFAKELISNHRL